MSCAQIPTGPEMELRNRIAENVTPLGARNWIVIAEASYPVYAGTGVQTVAVDAPSDAVFMEVLDILEAEGKLIPRIWICKEMDAVTEDYAPGIRKYRQSIGKLIPGRFHYSLPNRIINSQVEDAIKQFRVLVIKTNTTLPYSNICIELDSGYWSADSEAELRNRIERLEGPKPPIPPPVLPATQPLPSQPGPAQPAPAAVPSPSPVPAAPAPAPQPPATSSSSSGVVA